ncbi:membrane protein [Virgisporangium aliadipatigenens]|uniref:Membrane protein n=1 Tax=Virgisporangium aliadipatigenens TaxID=741659 RepID=A0A8J3YQT2_9ACTN|nr:MMPL family transporter [Virgisporangium aliadipatigenens]GIJ48300.1 membrane protein [Virgisporangium aliadipatigenens]
MFRRGRLVAWLALVLWTVAAIALLPLAGRDAEAVSTDAAAALPRDAETTRAVERIRAAFPGADAPVAVVVYTRDTGLTAEDRAAVEADRAAFGAAAGAAVESDDGRAVLVAVPVPGKGTQVGDTVRRIRQEVGDGPAGLRTAVTGSAGVEADSDEVGGEVETTLLLATVAVVVVLLLVTYRSPVLWLVPLIAVVLASQVAAAVVYLLDRHAGVTVTENSSTVMLILVFGVGTDYALLLIARYREELRRHRDRFTAMAVAWRRSFPAVLASAATVTVGLLCLLAASSNDVRGIGPVAAAGTVVAFAVMTTLLPAVLVLPGRWLFWPFVPRFSPSAEVGPVSRNGGWQRLAGAIGRRPRAVWVCTALLLVALSFGVFGLRLGQPADRMFTTEVESVVGLRMIERHFPGGASAPAEIIAAAPRADDVVAATSGVDGVADVVRVGVSADGRWVRVDAVLRHSPDSAAAEATVERLRRALHAVPGADALVGGGTAAALDTERGAARDNRLLMPLVLVVVLAVLVLLLRALVAPLLLVASVVLSYTAAMGVVGLVAGAIGYPHVMASLPMLGFVFLVTLGVDYSIFLMTRAREEVAASGHRDGILSALTVTGGVVTSAGVVLAATFSVLLVVPYVTALHLGLVVAVGVLIDTFLVRTLLVPALAIDLGARTWWPARPRVA